MTRLLAIIAGSLPTVAGAAQLDVGPTAPYATIMAAHAAAVDGDTISVAPGVYDEAFEFTKELTLVSTGGSAVTTLTSTTAPTWVVRIVNSVTIVGFEVDGRSGLRCLDVSGAWTVTLEDVHAHHGSAYYGAGLSMWDGDLVVLDSVFEDHTGGAGAALFLDDVVTTRIEGSTFARNTSTGDGGAIRAYGGGTLEISSSVFVDNWSDRWGGAVRPYANDLVTITDSLFERNAAATDGGAIQASTLLHFETDEVVVTRSVFIGNTAVSGDGGAYHGADANNRSPHLIAENLFVDNAAPAGNGGAVFVSNGFHPYYGYSLKPTRARILDNTFVSNHAASGAHLYTGRYVRNAVGNNVFANADPGGSAVFLRIRGFADHNLWYGNPSGDLDGRSHGANDVFADPLFVAWSDDGDPTNDDFHLQAGSPAIDAGYPGLLDPDGTISDIGYTAGYP